MAQEISLQDLQDQEESVSVQLGGSSSVVTTVTPQKPESPAQGTFV